MSTPTATRGRLRHPWGLAVGVVLVLPQLVLCVVVSRAPFLTALLGFLMTIGFVRLGSLGYRVLRERVPPVGRGWLALAGVLATIAGSLLWAQVATALRAAADPGYTGVVAPAATAWLNLVAVLTLGLWVAGAALFVWSAAGLVFTRRRA